MGVSGAKFLELSKANGLKVTGHALRRAEQHTGNRFSEEDALDRFRRARQLRPREMILLGYRPAYGRRLRRGCKSWYFHMDVGGHEIVAVVQQGGFEGEFVWVTCYAPGVQTRHYRLAEVSQLAYAS